MCVRASRLVARLICTLLLAGSLGLLCAERVRLARDVPQCAHHAVDLRVPRVGGDKYFHAACACASSGTGSLSSPVRVQVIISKRPSWPSATAVQLSTQSPQLM